MDVKKLIVISLYLEETSYLIQKFQFPYNFFSQSPGSRKTKYLTPQNYMNFARSVENIFQHGEFNYPNWVQGTFGLMFRVD